MPKKPPKQAQRDVKQAGQEPLKDLFVPSNEEALREMGIYYITQEVEEESLRDMHMDIVLKHLDKWKGDIQIVLNTPGGDAEACWSLVDLLDWVDQDVRTIALGDVSSAGAIILAAGTPGKRVCSANSTIMVHTFSGYGWVEGKQPEMIAQMKGVDLELRKHIRHWMRCSNLGTEADVLQRLLCPNDVYLSPDEALKLGIVDEVIPLKKRGLPKKKKKKK